MSETVLVALISAGGALIAGISDMRCDFNKRFERIDVRLDCVEEGLKHFYRLNSEHSTDIARLKDKIDTN